MSVKVSLADAPLSIKVLRLSTTLALSLNLAFAVVVLGVAGAVLGSFVGELFPSAALGAILMLGLMLGIVSLYALMAMFAQSTRILVVSIVVMTCLVVTQIILPTVWVVTHPLDATATSRNSLVILENTLAHAWASASNETRQRVGDAYHCCGAVGWPQNCYALDQHVVGTPENHYNMPLNYSLPCESDVTNATTRRVYEPQPSARLYPAAQCCVRGGVPMGVVNVTACELHEWLALCCAPTCTTDCLPYTDGCIDVLMREIDENQAAILIVGLGLGVVELIGVMMTTVYCIRFTQWRNTQLGASDRAYKFQRVGANFDDAERAADDDDDDEL